MKFSSNTLLLVVLTIGFRNIYADDWAQDRKRLGTHFFKFLQTFHEIVVDACDSEQRNDVERQQVAKHYGKFKSDSEEYGYVTNGETYIAFRNYTRGKIAFLWVKLSSSNSNLLGPQNSIKNAIEALAKDINGDTELSDKYKFERLPNLGYLETICIKYLGDSHHTSVDNWVRERKQLGTHFLKFLETFQGIVFRTSAGREHEQVEHQQVARLYGSEENGYVINGSNYTAFRNYTRTSIMFLWNRTSFIHLTQFEASQIPFLIKYAIEALAKDINEDSALPDKYKFERLPNRDYFERIYVEFFEVKNEEFLKICPTSPPTQLEKLEKGEGNVLENEGFNQTG